MTLRHHDFTRARALPWLSVIVAMWAAIGVSSADEHTAAPADAAELVRQFLERDEPRIEQYLAVRRLEARNERFGVEGWLEACTELRRGGTFVFTVIDEGGSDYIRGRVLHKALEAEREVWTTGEMDRGGLTLANYQFQPMLEDDADVQPVRLVPLRKDRVLVDGVIRLRRSDGDLIGLDGRMVRNPSFWTTRVEVSRTYARFGGVRLPVTLESTANVRMAGRSSFVMTYEYLTANDVALADDARCGGAPD
jgi:hypothetical protein